MTARFCCEMPLCCSASNLPNWAISLVKRLRPMPRLRMTHLRHGPLQTPALEVFFFRLSPPRPARLSAGESFRSGRFHLVDTRVPGKKSEPGFPLPRTKIRVLDLAETPSIGSVLPRI